jgi:hypothetical protein
MRRFRSARLLVIPGIVVPLVVSSVVLAEPAWAKHISSKPATCAAISGTVGGTWDLNLCSPTSIVGNAQNPNPNQGTVSQDFPTSPATIQWSPTGSRHSSGVQTTISFTVTARTGHHDRCGAGNSEVELKGSIVSNSPSGVAGLKGKVKMFVCEGPLGALSAQKKMKF